VKPAERIALIYGISLVSAGAYAYYQGQRGEDLLRDTAVHGLVLGTGLTLADWLVLAPPIAYANPSAKNMGTMSEEAIQLLQKLDVDTLYQDHKEGGVTVAPLPKNPSLILQDET